MAKFTSNIKFKDLKKQVVHEAEVEFEMTLKRAEELTQNINKNYPYAGFELTRTDVEEVAEEKTEEGK